MEMVPVARSTLVLAPAQVPLAASCPSQAVLGLPVAVLTLVLVLDPLLKVVPLLSTVATAVLEERCVCPQAVAALAWVARYWCPEVVPQVHRLVVQ
jgi:hypothetical protein